MIFFPELILKLPKVTTVPVSVTFGLKKLNVTS